jgi:hypothetical protein
MTHLRKTIDPDSFQGKLFLLLIDKLLIGAIIAIAFIAYDIWKIERENRLENKSREVQLEFERAKLIKEFLPIITSKQTNINTRAYALRSALITCALDGEAGVELGRNLLSEGLEDEHFKRVMKAAMPGGIPAVSRHALTMSRLWSEKYGSVFEPNAAIDPVSGQERIPPEMSGAIREARLWRAVLLEVMPTLAGYQPLDYVKELPSILPGLFVLLNPGDQFSAITLSQSESRGIALIGNISRVLFDPNDFKANEYIRNEVMDNFESIEGVQYQRTIIRMLAQYGPPSGAIAVPLARIVTATKSSKNISSILRTKEYWLKYETANLLLEMQKRSTVTGQKGARDAEPVLLDYLNVFRMSIMQAVNREQLERIADEYESGKLIRQVVQLIGEFNSKEGKLALEQLTSTGVEKLRHFPFLEHEISKALEVR